MKPLFAGIVLLLTTAALGDVLVLDDGTRVEGKAHRQGDQWIVTDAAGHETAVDAGRIKSFELRSTATGPAAAQDRLAALRGSVANLSDIHVIIDRYDRFIQQSAGAAEAQQAQDDLALWQRRLSENYQKVGDRWLTPMERQVLAADEAQSAAGIGDMIRQSQNDAAMDALLRALTADPDNPSALYLRGTLLFQRNQVPAARADFERAIKTVGDHPPTLNNLACTLWRQQNFGAAMAAYAKAMTAKPLDETILDNVAEAIHGLPDEYKDSPLAQRAMAIFKDQDKQLQKLKLADGQYRWGSSWVSRDKLAKLSAEKAANQSQLDSLRGQEQDILSSLAANQTQLDRTVALNNVYNPPAPPGYAGAGRPAVAQPDYYLVQQDLANLNAIKSNETDKLGHVREEIAKVERNYSVVEFTGIQRLYGPEGTPIRSEHVDQATTRPGG